MLLEEIGGRGSGEATALSDDAVSMLADDFPLLLHQYSSYNRSVDFLR